VFPIRKKSLISVAALNDEINAAKFGVMLRSPERHFLVTVLSSSSLRHGTADMRHAQTFCTLQSGDFYKVM
jgi:hypothetical protein